VRRAARRFSPNEAGQRHASVLPYLSLTFASFAFACSPAPALPPTLLRAYFITYKSGIYTHKTGAALGGHAVRIVGWGEEQGGKYWLVANSWNQYWGGECCFQLVVS
jgi:hypothetical protein